MFEKFSFVLILWIFCAATVNAVVMHKVLSKLAGTYCNEINQFTKFVNISWMWKFDVLQYLNNATQTYVNVHCESKNVPLDIRS